MFMLKMLTLESVKNTNVERLNIINEDLKILYFPKKAVVLYPLFGGYRLYLHLIRFDVKQGRFISTVNAEKH